MSETKFNFPTETIELPSKGLVYPEDHPLRSGTIEMKYMTAKEEDILSNANNIKNGTSLDKLMESLTMGKINVKDMVPGDKNAMFIAARVLGYGSEYSFMYGDSEETTKQYDVDLSAIENKDFDTSHLTEEGYGTFTLPKSETEITFRYLTEVDQDKIEKDVKAAEKKHGFKGGNVTTRLKHQIVSVDGNEDKAQIADFIDNYMLAQDSLALREFIKESSPDIDLTTTDEDGNEIEVPITIKFFYPHLGS